MSYKNLYEYDFINLYENVSGSSKPKYVSFKNKNIDFISTESQKFYPKTSKFNRHGLHFKSFHKSLLHLKLSSNPKFKDTEKICFTERSPKEKKEIKRFKNTYEKIFLTNTEEKSRNNKVIYPRIITDYRDKFDKDLINDKYINIPSNTFLPFKKNRYLYLLPETINVKIDDFIDDCKMLKKAKLINAIKLERLKKNITFLDLKFEEGDVKIYSLKKSLKLINIYKRVFGEYNKFLIIKIKNEKKILNDINIFQKGLEDQVNILQKQFDDIIKELEIVNNFKLIFTAIKNKEKLKDFTKECKIFIEGLKKNLKKKVKISKRNLNISTTKIINKNIIRKSKAITKSSFEFSRINSEEKNKDPKKRVRRSMSIITPPNLTKTKNRKKILERFNSIQPSAFEKKKRFESIWDNDNLDYDIESNERVIINNILRIFKKYNQVNSQIIEYKIISEREDNNGQDNKNNKLIENQKNNLIHAKNYNKSLISRYKILHYNNQDYSLHMAIYNKINQIISSVISSKLKSFNHIITKFKNIYDKNQLYYTYKHIVNDPKAGRLYFEKDIINYIYNSLVLIELLQCELINKKEEYKKNDNFREQILEYENKMITAKKIINNREKRNRDLLRKQQIFQKAIEKNNRIIFKSFRKVPFKYPPKIKTHLLTKDNDNEDEDFILY